MPFAPPIIAGRQAYPGLTKPLHFSCRSQRLSANQGCAIAVLYRADQCVATANQCQSTQCPCLSLLCHSFPSADPFRALLCCCLSELHKSDHCPSRFKASLFFRHAERCPPGHSLCSVFLISAMPLRLASPLRYGNASHFISVLWRHFSSRFNAMALPSAASLCRRPSILFAAPLGWRDAVPIHTLP